MARIISILSLPEVKSPFFNYKFPECVKIKGKWKVAGDDEGRCEIILKDGIPYSVIDTKPAFKKC